MSIQEYGYLDFIVIKEGWSEYKLENGSVVRVRHILQKVIKEESGLSINATTTVSVFSPPELKGSPSLKAYIPQELESSIVEENLEFETIKEDWNEYELEDKTKLYVKPVLTVISKTDKYDSYGEPLYLTQVHPLTKVIPRKGFRK
jgi:hypothetical protein